MRKNGKVLPRAARKVKQSEAGLDLLPDSVWQKFFPPGYMLNEESLALPDLFAPSHFVVAAKHLDAAAERENLAALRMSTSGSRQVVLARFQQVRTFYQADLVKKKEPATDLQNPASVWTRLKAMTPKDVKEFKNMDGQLFFATVAPWQVLYVPATFICVVPVLHETMVGIGRRVVVRDFMAAEDLSQYMLQLEQNTSIDMTPTENIVKLITEQNPNPKQLTNTASGEVTAEQVTVTEVAALVTAEQVIVTPEAAVPKKPPDAEASKIRSLQDRCNESEIDEAKADDKKK